MLLESIANCCSSLQSYLPHPELPIIPALIMGIICSLIILTLMYKRHHKMPFWRCFIQLLKDIFVTVPTNDHAEFMFCTMKNCIRCQNAENLKVSVVTNWKKIEQKNKEEKYSRISEAISNLINPDKDYNKKNVNQKPTIFRLNLPTLPIWTDYECYTMEKELLKTNFNVLKEEFEFIYEYFQKGNIQGWKLNHIPAGHWCTFPIIDQGIINEDNCIKCPNTCALLTTFPSLMKNCVFGNVCFSLLYPASYIEPHYGPTNMRLRCHFAIDIPEGCWLEVDGRQLKWKSGDCIVFDDSFEHSAYYGPNKAYEKPRVVLLIDFWHPGVSVEEKEILLQLLQCNVK